MKKSEGLVAVDQNPPSCSSFSDRILVSECSSVVEHLDNECSEAKGVSGGSVKCLWSQGGWHRRIVVPRSSPAEQHREIMSKPKQLEGDVEGLEQYLDSGWLENK